ncbi:tetraacyldisaccharide 4'-kinase [Thiofilum flexile]|uniref:tetraacyldisaccharide 4'-kinase n=1 Tax=Thiofilum flexile TaxID=125627 RepID=UPI00037D2D41|nr:tetraacyldisaccharide 4'-kinase [Thiofilum flexile]
MASIKLLTTQFFESIWYQPKAPFWAKLIFKPLELIYCYLSTHQRLHTIPTKHPIPIIVIGNLTVGGTGKTPLLIHLVQLLQKQGFQPAVISRGYAVTKPLVEPLIIKSTTLPIEAGDEPVLIYQRTQIPVCVFPKRNAAIKKLLEHYPSCNVILSDDGLQHTSMGRDIEIVVIDGERLLGNQHCLPLGPLRESVERLNQIDFKVVNGGSSNLGFKMHIVGKTLYSLKDKSICPLADFAPKTVNVVTGIGNPERFLMTLRQAGLQPILKRFPDHHAFEANDFLLDNDYPILMTEKDAVKCHHLALSNAWYLPITLAIDPVFEELLLQRLQEVSTQCKSNY